MAPGYVYRYVAVHTGSPNVTFRESFRTYVRKTNVVTTQMAPRLDMGLPNVLLNFIFIFSILIEPFSFYLSNTRVWFYRKLNRQKVYANRLSTNYAYIIFFKNYLNLYVFKQSSSSFPLPSLPTVCSRWSPVSNNFFAYTSSSGITLNRMQPPSFRFPTSRFVFRTFLHAV